MFSAKPTFVPAGPRARIAWTARPCPSTPWCRTWFSSPGGELQPRRGAEVDRLPAADLHVDAPIALHERLELVDGEVVLHAVAELLGHVAGVVGERLRRLRRLPAARGPGAPAAGPSGRASRTAGSRRRAARRPGGCRSRGPSGSAGRCRRGRPVAMRSRSGRRRRRGTHQRHVLPVAVVVVVRDVAGGRRSDVAGRVRERVPDRRALAVLVACALDLVRRGGDAPMEPLGEAPGD